MKTKHIRLFLTIASIVISFVILLVFGGKQKYAIEMIYVFLYFVFMIILDCYLGEMHKSVLVFIFGLLNYILIVSILIHSLLLFSDGTTNSNNIINLLTILSFVLTSKIRNISVFNYNGKIMFMLKTRDKIKTYKIQMYLTLLVYIATVFFIPSFDPTGQIMNSLWIVILLDNIIDFF